MYAVELHTHSSASYDGEGSVDSILSRASDIGLDAVAITDHDEIWASREAAERAPEYGLVGIVAMEVSSAAGHVLALNIDEPIEPGLSFAETVTRIRDQGGIAVVPHPFQEMRSGVLAKISKAELRDCDAIEVYNSRLITGWSNRQARRFAAEHDIPMIAGSDAHNSAMVGRSITFVDAEERSADAICDAVCDGRTMLETRRTPWRVSFYQAIGNTRRRIRLFVSSLLR